MKQSKEISEKLLLPTKIDYVDSVLSSSKASLNPSLNPPQMGESWFSIDKKKIQKNKSCNTSLPLSQFSLPNSMGYEVMESKKEYKTLKIRILPNEEERKIIDRMEGQFRWYYNTALAICRKEHPGLKTYTKLSSTSFRDTVMKYDYKEQEEINTETGKKIIVKDFVRREKILREVQKKNKKYNVKEDGMIDGVYCFKDSPKIILMDLKEESKLPYPTWCENAEVHTRTARAGIKSFVDGVNSALANLRAGNIVDFNTKVKSKKDDRQIISYEDENFPAFFKKIKSRYTYSRNDKVRSNRRTTMTFNEILNTSKASGFTLVHDKSLDYYFIHYPVPFNWFPKVGDDRRSETQAMTTSNTHKRIIALDPGVRKFMVGYDGENILVVGDKANKEILELLYMIDTLTSQISKKNGDDDIPKLKLDRCKLWFKVKNLINELHWKTIRLLMTQYDIIFLPEFRISKMVTKHNISRQTKRMLYMFSYHSFKEKLAYKCDIYNKKLYIVDESYTSKTCCRCGILNDVKGSEVYKCSSCNLVIDRDYNGAVNIFTKNANQAPLLVNSGFYAF